MKQGQQRTLWATVLILGLVIAAVCIGILVWLRTAQAKVDQQLETASSSQTEASSEAIPEQANPDDIPIDFDYLHEINEDIYGWIELHATEQGYPVLSNEDPDHYLHLDINGNYSVSGSIYTQSTYNKTDFSDPCMLIYGHDLSNGTMFGGIQRAIPRLDLDDAADRDNYFTLYTPTSYLTCRICAAGVFNTDHILYYYDFEDKADFERFFADLASYPIGTPYASSDFAPVFGDQLAILSTCYAKDYNQRFLIVGVVTEKNGVPVSR